MTELFNSRLPVIEDRLMSLMPRAQEKYGEAAEAMKYSLLSGGKRIRPILLLEFYRLCGGNDGKALNFAAALEMIHTYSLIHDDLPCMDNDDMRRGRPSCHIRFGEDTALLAGDALLTYAFEVAAKTDDLPPERVLRAVSVLSQMAGISGMIGGQVMDLGIEKNGAEASDLETMYLKKTSCLLEAAAVIGCILAGADERYEKYASEYAKKVGLAFQIIDDILDVTSDEATLGKPIGSDEKNGKTTYVTLFGLEEARKKAAELSSSAIDTLSKFNGDSRDLIKLTEYLLDRKY